MDGTAGAGWLSPDPSHVPGWAEGMGWAPLAAVRVHLLAVMGLGGRGCFLLAVGWGVPAGVLAAGLGLQSQQKTLVS